MWQTLVSRFKSRKFVTALIATLVGTAAYFGSDMPPALIAAIVGVFGFAIAGDAYEDGQAKGATKSIAIGGDVGNIDSAPPATPAPEVKS